MHLLPINAISLFHNVDYASCADLSTSWASSRFCRGFLAPAKTTVYVPSRTPPRSSDGSIVSFCGPFAAQNAAARVSGHFTEAAMRRPTFRPRSAMGRSYAA